MIAVYIDLSFLFSMFFLACVFFTFFNICIFFLFFHFRTALTTSASTVSMNLYAYARGVSRFRVKTSGRIGRNGDGETSGSGKTKRTGIPTLVALIVSGNPFRKERTRAEISTTRFRGGRGNIERPTNRARIKVRSRI